MELFRRRSEEATDDYEEENVNIVMGKSAVANRVEVSVRRSNGSLYEYCLPKGRLGVIFTVNGSIELSQTDENH